LLIAYFQESSIIFRQDSERFYDTIEANYGLKDAFKGWRRHMTLDLDHDHAGELEARFDDAREITLEEAKVSLRTVQLAQFFLLKALDQIAEHCHVANAVPLRLPTALAPGDQSGGSIELSRPSALFLLAALRDAAFRALALARTHDQIILAGKLASKLDSVSNELAVDVAAPWHVACRNFLVERAVEPEVVTALAPMFLALIARGCPDLADVAGFWLKDETDVTPDLRIDVAFHRLRELIVLAATEGDLPDLELV
jgi:hypothetical protein